MTKTPKIYYPIRYAACFEDPLSYCVLHKPQKPVDVRSTEQIAAIVTGIVLRVDLLLQIVNQLPR